MSKDYFVTITIKNGPMKRLMELNGFNSASELSRACGVHSSTIGGYLCLRKKAMNHDGEWSPAIIKISAVLKCLPQEMFPPQHIKYALEKNTSSSYMNIQDVNLITNSLRTAALPADEVIMKREASEAINSVLSELPEIQRDILSRRFGLNGPEQTLEEVANFYGITRERVRQREANAIRQIRYTSLSKKIRPFIKQVYEDAK